MKIRWNITLLLSVVTIIFSVGCSNLDSLVRSVENTFGKEKPEAVVDTAMLDEAGRAWQSGNITLAEERYKEYIEKNQRSGDNVSLATANSQLGRIAFDKNDFKASNRYFDEAIKLNPDNLDVRGLYGESLYWQKEYTRAEALCHQALQIAPNDRRFQIVLGRTMAQQKQYQAGLRYLKQALGEQGAYEEMARIYQSHSEFDKATLAMSKARESYSKQQQLAANFPGGGLPNNGVSAPMRVDQRHAAFPATQNPSAMQPQPYHPMQAAFPPQQQPVAMQRQQATRQQQNVTPQQAPVQQYQYPYQYAVQQPAQSFPQQQQPVIIPNIPHSNSYQPQYPPPVQNYGATYGTMNPAAQQGFYSGQYSGPPMPQQAYENYPQPPQDNRPPQGFAATGQRPIATAPTAGTQSYPVPIQQNHREIAWHTNSSDTQSGAIQADMVQPGTIMQPGTGTMYPMAQTPGMSSPEMPSSINPLAERFVSQERSPTPFPANSAMPMTGNRNNQTQSQGGAGYPPY